MPHQLTDEEVDALLEATGDNLDTVAERLIERKRKRAHAREKAKQPKLGLNDVLHDGLIDGLPHEQFETCPCETCVHERLRAFWRAPLTANDLSQDAGSMQHLVQTVQDCVDARDAEDVIFAAMRVARKVWAWNHHLGPIEGGKR